MQSGQIGIIRRSYGFEFSPALCTRCMQTCQPRPRPCLLWFRIEVPSWPQV